MGSDHEVDPEYDDDYGDFPILHILNFIPPMMVILVASLMGILSGFLVIVFLIRRRARRRSPDADIDQVTFFISI